MLNMMRADMYRIFRGKGVYTTFAIMLAFAILTVFVFRSAMQVGFVEDIPEALEVMTGAYAAPIILNSMDILMFFFLPFIIILAVSPFSSNAVKNELTIGISRVKFYLSKFALSSILSVIFMALYLVISVALATTVDGFGYWGNGLLTDVVQSFGMQILFALALNGVGMFFSFITRNTGATVGIYLAIILAPQLIIGLLGMAFPGVMEFMYYDLASQFGIFAQVSRLSGTEIARGIAVGLGYLLIPTIGGIMLFRKAEIK